MRRASILLISLLALVSVGCASSTERRPVSLREQWAPSDALEGEIAYVRETGVGRSSLFILDAASGDETKVPVPGDFVSSPAWSPSGDLLAFSVTDDKDWSQLWLSKPDGSDAVRLTRGLSANDYAVFTPDGRSIIFSSTRGDDGRWHLYRIAVTGGKPERLTDGPADDVYPAISPDGRRVIYATKAVSGGGFHLASLDLASGTTEVLTEGSFEDMFPEFSPDGSKVVFSSTRRDDIWQLFTYDLDDGRVASLVGSDSVDRYPAYSPDGRFVLLATDHLAVYPADGETLPGGDLRWRLTEEPGLSPTWR